jgi:dolichol-phosphate mannosyltransferase
MLISIILPCYNEGANLGEVYGRLSAVMRSLTEDYEIIFIDDGSTDETQAELARLAESDHRVKAIGFSRNFGHQAAISAGLDYARGEAVIMMDADLQHPPELIPLLVEKWRQGFEVVNTTRNDPPDIPRMKKFSARLFYRLINTFSDITIPENSADFRLLDGKVADEFRSLKEGSRFVRGLVSWVGFRQCFVPYDASQRHAGKSKYTFTRMVRFGLEGITSFSVHPLQIATLIGAAVSVLSFLYAAYAVSIRLFTDQAVPGWASVLVALLFLSGVQLLSLGVIGIYLGKVWMEVKSRPNYVIRSTFGMDNKRPPGFNRLRA